MATRVHILDHPPFVVQAHKSPILNHFEGQVDPPCCNNGGVHYYEPYLFSSLPSLIMPACVDLRSQKILNSIRIAPHVHKAHGQTVLAVFLPGPNQTKNDSVSPLLCFRKAQCICSWELKPHLNSGPNQKVFLGGDMSSEHLRRTTDAYTERGFLKEYMLSLAKSRACEDIIKSVKSYSDIFVDLDFF